jgi:hypothetical protein
MATWGDTKDYDATGGQQPRGTGELTAPSVTIYRSAPRALYTY